MILASNCPGAAAVSSSFKIDHLAQLNAAEAIVGVGDVQSAAHYSSRFSRHRSVKPKQGKPAPASNEVRVLGAQAKRTVSAEPT